MQLENLSRKGEHYRITVISRDDDGDLREETADHYSLRVAKAPRYNDVTKQHASHTGVRIVLRPSTREIFAYEAGPDSSEQAESLFHDISQRFHAAVQGDGIVDLRSVTGHISRRDPAHNNTLPGYKRYG